MITKDELAAVLADPAAPLAKKAEAVRAHHKFLSATKETGFHPEDKGYPPRQGRPDPLAHLVAFRRRDAHVFAGPDAANLTAALKRAAEQFREMAESDDTTDRKTLRAAREFAAAAPDPDGLVAVPHARWNEVLHALRLVGVGVTTA